MKSMQFRVMAVAICLLQIGPSIYLQQLVCWNACKMMYVIWGGGSSVTEHEHATCQAIMPVIQNTGNQDERCNATILSTRTRPRVGQTICSNYTVAPTEGRLAGTDEEGDWTGSATIFRCQPKTNATLP